VGGSCDPNSSLPNHGCSNEAPYCVESFAPPGFIGPALPGSHYKCSTAPTYEQKCGKSGKHPDSCDTAIGWFGYTPEAFFKSVIQIFLALGGTILLFTIILNGYKFMASQGDPEKVKEAREAITSAVAGLLIIIFSLVILQFITSTVLHLPGFN
jgi:hypothetical protein